MLTLSPDSRFAHRGLHDAAMPRNSMPAFIAAAEAGYGIELDVHLSSDGVPFVSHDADTLADTGMHLFIGATRSEVLRELTFAGTGIHLSTLDEVVREIPSSTQLLVEIKPTRRVTETVDAVTALLRGRERSVALQSFQPSIVLEARRHHPGFTVGQLVEAANDRMPLYERWYWRTLVTNALTRPQFLAVYLSALLEPAVRFWRTRLDVPVLGWTVTSEHDIATCRAADAGLIFEVVRP